MTTRYCYAYEDIPGWIILRRFLMDWAREEWIAQVPESRHTLQARNRSRKGAALWYRATKPDAEWRDNEMRIAA